MLPATSTTLAHETRRTKPLEPPSIFTPTSASRASTLATLATATLAAAALAAAALAPVVHLAPVVLAILLATRVAPSRWRVGGATPATTQHGLLLSAGCSQAAVSTVRGASQVHDAA